MKERTRPEPGEWVLLRDDEIIACDSDVARLMELARRYSPGEVVISKEPVSQHCYY
ncbi:MAG: hypothetical protein QW379_09900 [Thermoplasmata archaeon]